MTVLKQPIDSLKTHINLINSFVFKNGFDSNSHTYVAFKYLNSN